MILCACAGFVVTAGCAAIARYRAPYALALLLFVADTILCWFFLPRGPVVGFVSAVMFWIYPITSNFAALELRRREGRTGLGSYVFDVCTMSANRLAKHAAGSPDPLALLLPRGILFGAAAALAIALLRTLPAYRMPDWWWLSMKIAVVAVGAQALSDLTVSALGGRVVPSMRLPWLSTSYADFWGRRYNLWMHGFLLWLGRDLLGLGRRRLLLVAAAFAASGLVHEALSTMVLRRVTGWWTAFWAVQFALTILTRRIPGWAGRAVFFATFLASAPLFFAVLDRVCPMFGPVTPEPW